MEIQFRTIGEVIGALGLIIFAGMALLEEKAYFCDDNNLVMNCDKLSQYYGLENGKCWNAEYGNKLCRSGWNSISDLLEADPITIGVTFKVEANGGTFICQTADGLLSGYTKCIKQDGKEGYLGELIHPATSVTTSPDGKICYLDGDLRRAIPCIDLIS